MSLLGPLSNAERQRRFRERKRQPTPEPIYFERADWKLFLDPATLPQKAGCQPHQLIRVVLKEITDNALDAAEAAGKPGAVEIQQHVCRDGLLWIVIDDGHGIDPDKVADLFAVNRPLMSSKLIRRPSRGALGNGLRVATGAAVAFGGSLSVATRGRRIVLGVDMETGETIVTDDQPCQRVSGTAVALVIGPVIEPADDDGTDAQLAIDMAQHGSRYTGHSSPWWYSPARFHALLQAAPCATVEAVCERLDLDHADPRPAGSLSEADAAALLDVLQAAYPPVRPERLGSIGRDAFPGHSYAIERGEAADSEGAPIPFVVETWASCRPAEARKRHEGHITLMVNGTPVIRGLDTNNSEKGMFLRGCGIMSHVGIPAGRYAVAINLTTPFVRLASDGKEPALLHYERAIIEAVGKAARAANRSMDRPKSEVVTIIAAAFSVMEDAYMAASGNGRLPATPRQIYYAARPAILELTGKTELDDNRFTQEFLPNFRKHNPEITADWKVNYDARGSLIEPHTGREIGLGTAEVEEYVRDMLAPRRASRAAIEVAAPKFETVGPVNRYSAVLFVEKEGFHGLLAASQIAERFDISIQSTKGMSVVAAREVLDHLASLGVRVFVLHDFDVSGFEIAGTLGADSRRYDFKNYVPITDFGLRLADVEAMDLQSESVEPKHGPAATRATLERHGATEAEIEFLLGKQRVELNAMTAPQFVELIERKLTEHGVGKVVPGAAVLAGQYRELQRARALEARLAPLRDALDAEVAAALADSPPPADLDAQVCAYLASNPAVAWDDALAAICRETD